MENTKDLDIHSGGQEILDVVNEDDVIIGPETRKEIHDLGLLHREVHVWFFDANKNIIFQKRGVHKLSGGTFDATVGGHVDSKEDYLTTAIREGQEETGKILMKEDLILLKKIRNSFYISEKNATNNYFRSVYIYRHPVLTEDLKKEEGNTGVDFQKFHVNFFDTITAEDVTRFDVSVIKDEVPLVIEYILENPV